MDPSLIEKYPSLKKLEELGDDYEEWNDGREIELLKYIYNHEQLAEMRNNPRKICQAMDDFANQHDFLINIGSDKALKVCDIIAREKPKVFVEIGGYLGYSAIFFADAMRGVYPNDTSLKYWSLEADPLFASITMNLVDLAGLSNVIKVVTGYADASLNRLIKEGQLAHADMLFLDHDEARYSTELKLCEGLGLLKPGSCIIADNVLRPGAPEYREYVRSHAGLETTSIPGLIMPGEFEDEMDLSRVL